MYETMRKAIALRRQGNYPAAVTILDSLLSEELERDQRSEVFAFRADLKEDMGNYTNAKEDLLMALALCEEGSYSQYTLELSLGGLSEKLHKGDEAASWYLKALVTSSKAEDISAGAAVKNLLRIKGEDRITDQERLLCNQAVEKSWRLLHLPGVPDLSNLTETAATLIEAAGKGGA